MPDAVSGKALERLQSAWLRESVPARAAWEAEKAKGTGPDGMGYADGTWVARTYFDLPRFAEADPSFRDLLDNPKVLPLIKAVMGGKVVLDQIQGRTVPSGPGINQDGADVAAGYVGWHRDSPDHIATHLDFSISIKAFTFPFNVTPDGGVSAIIPGTHRVQFGPTRVSEEFKAARLRTFPAKAGTCVFYDNRVWHTALPNTSGRDRCCLIASYKSAGGCSEGTNARAVSGQVFGNAARLDACGALDNRPELRTLLGLDVDYHTEAFHLANPTPDNM